MKIPKSEEPEWPKIGIPLEIIRGGGRKKIKIVYRGHIIEGRGVGKFVEPEFDSESKCLEYSAELVVEMRKNGNSS